MAPAQVSLLWPPYSWEQLLRYASMQVKDRLCGSCPLCKLRMGYAGHAFLQCTDGFIDCMPGVSRRCCCWALATRHPGTSSLEAGILLAQVLSKLLGGATSTEIFCLSRKTMRTGALNCCYVCVGCQSMQTTIVHM